MSIYGQYESYLPLVLQEITDYIIKANIECKEKTGFKLYEHFISRIKDANSMTEKCQRKGLEVSTYSALKVIKDSIGMRIICGFVDDIYKTVALLKEMPNVTVFQEKDYIINAKPNGYRSYHLILEVHTDFPSADNDSNGAYFVEIQLRTIAQDSWASLEHQMKYKKILVNLR